MKRWLIGIATFNVGWGWLFTSRIYSLSVSPFSCVSLPSKERTTMRIEVDRSKLTWRAVSDGGSET